MNSLPNTQAGNSSTQKILTNFSIISDKEVKTTSPEEEKEEEKEEETKEGEEGEEGETK